jgi:hypothetical protein
MILQMRASPLASDNPRAFFEKAAVALDGERGTGAGVASWLCSGFDPFLNQLFVEADARPEEAARRLAGRPGFVWMASEPAPDAQRRMQREGFTFTAFHAMQADGVAEERDDAPAPVRGHRSSSARSSSGASAAM